jgi:hypothetical protein
MKDWIQTADDRNEIIHHSRFLLHLSVGFEVLTAVVMNSSILWDIILISFLKLFLESAEGVSALSASATVWSSVPAPDGR